jgi:exosortase A-associated hydrolase 2
LLKAFHILSPSGNLAAVYHVPEPGSFHFRNLLFIHGFAHEQMVVRPVVAKIWRRLACEGTGVLSLDLPGCGDSWGDLGDATWESWLAAVETAHRWLTCNSVLPAHIGGVRLGASLAAESMKSLAWASGLLMQPVVRGDEMMTQFLRLRVAFSALRADTEERVTTQTLRARLAGGETLEVGGFLLSPAMATAIDRVDLGSLSPRVPSTIQWLACGKQPLTPAAENTVHGWKAKGVSVDARIVDVKPYWVHTRGLVDEYEALSDAVAEFYRGLAK